ncbi:uncharacterized protein [Malus domestica]|uniref:uncharacterized protein isoform X1 n=1 Tax=Malus domestica TaxID=3750 RepID=UPI00049898A4|nr:uncharacterized protein LOC103411913 isoform X1 [Malus domestica]
MGSSAKLGLEMFEVGPCEDAYTMGFLIGQRFSDMIKSRLASDLILHNQLLPFAQTPEFQPLLQSLTENNRNKFPRYWEELVGTADGSGVPVLDVITIHTWASSEDKSSYWCSKIFIILINFRKEILPLLPKTTAMNQNIDTLDDCSDVLVVSDSMAVVAHNEDANVALVGHTYLIKGTLSNGISFMAYTYAGELPSCAFGLNTHGLAFTLNSVPPSENEIVAGGIGRNFVSRDLLEASSIDDALCRIKSSEVSVGHSYNLIETRTRKIMNVETASRKRVSIYEVGATPFFHANMYLHLQVNQLLDENSIARQSRAAALRKRSKDNFLSLLGDTDDPKYPIYMIGPLLYTLCTAVIDLDEQTLSIVEGNPRKGKISHIFSTCTEDFKMP